MTAQERKTIRRPLCYMAAAVLAMALPSAGLTLRNKSAASVDSLSGSSSRNLMRPSPRGGESATIQMMLTDERQEFELNLGKAVDALKHDYPDILTEPPGTYSTATRLSTFESHTVRILLLTPILSFSVVIQTFLSIIQT